MITLMLSDTNKHECQVLEAAFTQQQFVVIRFDPSYKFYIKLLQYAPEIVLMELPPLCKDHLHFIELMRKHKKLKPVPVIGFGDIIDTMIFNYYRKIGLNSYIARPLKFSSLTDRIETHLHKKVLSEDNKIQHSKQDDLALLLDSNVLPLKKVEYIVDRISKLLAFPFTATKVMSLSNNDTSGAKQLAQVINADPTISAQILKVANSVFFASMNRRIASIHDAIVRIGFSETKRIVMSMAIMNLFDKNQHNAGFNRTGFWYHCIGCAVISERIARRGSLVNPDEAFLSGLLHDLGILLMDEYFPTVLSHLINITSNNESDFIDEEKNAMSITHIDFTTLLFERWKIPVNIIRGISKKENFRTHAHDMIEDSQIAFCIGMAETLAKSMAIGLECDQFVKKLPNELFSIARLAAGFNDTFVAEIDNDILFYQQFLKLDQTDMSTTPGNFRGVDNLKVAAINLSKELFVPPIIFLRKEGVSVTEFFAVDNDKLHQQFDILLVWATENLADNVILDFTKIIRRTNEQLTLMTSLSIPVLLMIDPESSVKNIDNPQISILPNSLDLRTLQHVLSEVLDGSRYNYFKECHPVKQATSVQTSIA